MYTKTWLEVPGKYWRVWPEMTKLANPLAYTSFDEAVRVGRRLATSLNEFVVLAGYEWEETEFGPESQSWRVGTLRPGE